MNQANLYAQYRPAKVHEGEDHPDPIVESQVGGSGAVWFGLWQVY